MSIIDIAYRAGCPWYTCDVPNCQPECENYRLSALEILRAALPWSSSDCFKLSHYNRLMRELYPEKFR